jgi:hypothetical protein
MRAFPDFTSPTFCNALEQSEVHIVLGENVLSAVLHISSIQQ